ncbi:hypothetical protein Tco_1577201 [Tanacetum coccineum]
MGSDTNCSILDIITQVWMIGLANYLERESEVSSERKCNSMKCDKKNNQQEDDDNEEDAENEENADNEEDADNNEEYDDNEEEADNEDQDDNEENVDQVLKKIKTLPFLNAAKRSMKKEYGKDITKTVEEKQHKKKRKMERSETEEPEKKKSNRQKSTYKGTMKKSGSKKNPIIEESPKRFTRQAEFENIDKQNEAEDDKHVKSISSGDVIV